MIFCNTSCFIVCGLRFRIIKLIQPAFIWSCPVFSRRPPCDYTKQSSTGRPMSELILAYDYWRTQPLSDLVKISDWIFATRITNLTLQDYCWVRKLHCSSTHSNCTECSLMLTAADMILTKGIVQFLETSVAQSDQESVCLRYAVYRASG